MPNLGGIKDAVENGQNDSAVCTAVGLCAQMWWSWKCIPWVRAAKCLVPCTCKRLKDWHTFFRSPVVSRFERSENVAIHLYTCSLIMSAAALPAFGSVAWGTSTGLKFSPLYLRMRIPYRLKAKVPSRTQWRACLKQITGGFALRCWAILLGFMCVPLIIWYTGFQYSVSNTKSWLFSAPHRPIYINSILHICSQ